MTEELFPGFHFSACSYICYLLQAKVIDDLELRRHGLEILPIDPWRFLPLPDGRRLLIWNDVGATQEEIARFSRRDAAAYPGWVRFWERAAGLVYPYFLQEPPTLEEVADRLRGTADGEFLERLLVASMVSVRSVIATSQSAAFCPHLGCMRNANRMQAWKARSPPCSRSLPPSQSPCRWSSTSRRTR